jgi:hypothetical protein
MGYHTEFQGSFILDKPLSEDHKNYLNAFSHTRRMQRDSLIAQGLPDPLREKVELPIGEQACYFVGGTGFAGQDQDDSIVEYNYPPSGQPGLWCQWVPNSDGTAIEWDEGEKFYYYVEWITYLINNFLKPWGYTINGKVSWRGESFNDIGTIVINDSVVHTTKEFV